MKFKLTSILLGAALCAVPSFASSIVLAVNGDASVGPNYISFGVTPNSGPYVAAPGSGVFMVDSPVSDLFASNGVTPGELGSIQSLNATLEPVGQSVDVNFIKFSGTGGSNLMLYLTQLVPGTYAPAISPFNLTQTPTGVDASFDALGYIYNTADNSATPYTGIFSATFSGQTIASLTSSFPINTAFSGTFSITPVPEPASLVLVGAGLLGAGLMSRRKTRRS